MDLPERKNENRVAALLYTCMGIIEWVWCFALFYYNNKYIYSEIDIIVNCCDSIIYISIMLLLLVKDAATGSGGT